MNPVHDETYPEFLSYWNEQFNLFDVYIRITPQPNGYSGWAANRTMLEICLAKVGITGQINYNYMPNYPTFWLRPAYGNTALETAKLAVDIYTQDLNNPKRKIHMNMACYAIADHFRKIGTHNKLIYY